MLTALTIIDKRQSRWYKRLINFIRGDSIKLIINTARGVTVHRIIYINRKDNINWNKISSLAGEQKSCIICKSDVVFPDDMGFVRFRSYDFEERISVNMAIFVIKQVYKILPKLKVGLYDPDGSYCDALAGIVKYTSDIKVVTSNKENYEDVMDRIMEEYGAVVVTSDNIDSISDCHIVIAPKKIEEIIPIRQKALVLTGQRPAVCLGGLVYYRYCFRMPNKFERIKPAEISDEYFTSVLYSKAKQYNLGTIVPAMCRNDSSVQTLNSLVSYVNNMVEDA